MADAPVEGSLEQNRRARTETTSPPDVFLLYNSKQEGIGEVVAGLRALGLSVWYSVDSLAAGEDWDERETLALEQAALAVAIIGRAGWGPYQQSYTEKAVAMDKRVIPAVLVEANADDFGRIGGLFLRLKRVVLKTPQDPEALAEIAAAVGDLKGEEASLRPQSPRLPEGPPKGIKPAAIIQQLKSPDSDDRELMLDELERLVKTYDCEPLRIAIQAELADKSLQVDQTGVETALMEALAMTLSGALELRKLAFESLTGSNEPSLLKASPTVWFAFIAGIWRGRVNDDVAPFGVFLDQAPDRKTQLLVNYSFLRRPSEHTEALRDQFRSETASVLEILRVVAIPELIEELLLEVQQRPSTAAILALSHSELAATLPKQVGSPQQLAALIASLCPFADPARRFLFGRILRLLSVFAQQQVEKVLSDLVANAPSSAGGARAVLEALQDGGYVVAGFRSEGSEDTPDDLGVKEDVQTLASVVLARDVHPPLSIGLFGDWGTGKSFFMDRLQKRIVEMCRDVEQSGRQARFHTRVAHIRFNTWHYIDANLWASLVSHIMEELVRAVSLDGKSEEELKQEDEKKQAEVRKALVAELETAKQLKRDVTQEKDRAVAARGSVQTELSRVAQERAKRQVTLADIRLSDFWSTIRRDPEIEKGIEAVKALGMPKVVSSVTELEATVNEAHTLAGRARAVLLELPKNTNRWALFLLVAVLVGLGPLAIWLRELLKHNNQAIAAFLAPLLQVLATLTAAANAIKKPLQVANAHLAKVGETKARAVELLEAKRKERSSQEIELEHQVNELLAQEASAAKQLSDADAKIREIDGKLREIDDGQSLSKYLLERIQADDYRRHLGLVSTIRRDFEKLASLLNNAAKTMKTKPVERIVLYVDDLDRCPAPRVLEVLQAVHLLLAFKLFVVVVGVDPRWLMHSLQKTYSAFRPGGNQRRREWQTTPQNYLEKIFQIPFHLNPMDSAGFTRLMTTLLPVTGTRSNVDAASPPAPKPAVHEASPIATTGVAGASAPGAAPETTDSSAVPPASAAGTRQPIATEARQPAPAVAVASPPAAPVNYAALRICAQERDFSTCLLAFIPSPRAANRFSNVYRLLKARLPDRKTLEAFEGTAAAPGDFRAVMLLLAITTAYPESASRVFGRLLAANRAGSPAYFFDDAELAGFCEADRRSFAKHLGPLLHDLPGTLEPFVAWAPHVARFSFNAGRALQERSASV